MSVIWINKVINDLDRVNNEFIHNSGILEFLKLDIGLFRLSISYSVGFGSLSLPGICPFCLCGKINVCRVCRIVTSIPAMGNLGLFFLVSIAQVSQYYWSQRNNFWYYWLFSIAFVFYFIDLSSDIYYFLSPANFEFNLHFLV